MIPKGNTFAQNLGFLFAILLAISIFIIWYLMQIANSICIDVADGDDASKQFLNRLAFVSLVITVVFFISYGYNSYMSKD